jgi:hypothetical protein
MRRRLLAAPARDRPADSDSEATGETSREEQTIDGGYPVDSDLHQQTDDGCPLTPDPTRWADSEWQDGGCEQVAQAASDPAGDLPAAGAVTASDTPSPGAGRSRLSRFQRLVAESETRARWSACCARISSDRLSSAPPRPLA